jgi:hypothetical protein
MTVPEFNCYGKYKDTVAIIFVGGYGDSKDYHSKPLMRLSASLQMNVYSFSFRDGKNATFSSQINDLIDLCIYLLEKKDVKELKIICTSDGAASSTFVLLDKRIESFISVILFLDPAVYYLDDIPTRPLDDWKGFQDFLPKKKMYGEVLKEANFNAVLHVIHFSLRNYSSQGYVDDPLTRGLDIPTKYSRMNKASIKHFYECIPLKNKGVYREVSNLPHAYMRDGEIANNINNVVQLISSLL